MTESLSTATAVDWDNALDAARSQKGQTLRELSEAAPLLVVFLRHAGCTFCREALSDIAARRAEIEQAGTRIALVLMSSDERAAAFVDGYGLGDLPRFSDPEQRLYRAFELENGSLWQLFGPRVLWRGLKAALWERHGFGMLEGNGLRLPGVFLLHHGKMLRAFRHQTAGDRPDYEEMARCPIA